MKRLLKSGKFKSGKRPSEHVISEKGFLSDNKGSISHNVLELEQIDENKELRLPYSMFSISNTKSNDFFTKTCKQRGITPHPARMPLELASFFIEFLTDEGDIVLDPFCGSGTTLVAAKMKGRNYIGIDVSIEAIELTKSRLETPVKTESELLKKGRSSYVNADEKSLAILTGLDVIPVHRNAGIDAILKRNYLSKPVPIRVQREHETLSEAAAKLAFAAKKKGALVAFLVATNRTNELIELETKNDIVKIINSPALEINEFVEHAGANKSFNSDALTRAG